MKPVIYGIALCAFCSQASAAVSIFDFTATVARVERATSYPYEVLNTASFDNTTFSTGYTIRGTIGLDSDTETYTFPENRPIAYFADFNGLPGNFMNLKVDQTGYTVDATINGGSIMWGDRYEFNYSTYEGVTLTDGYEWRGLYLNVADDRTLFPGFTYTGDALPVVFDFSNADSIQLRYVYVRSGQPDHQIVFNVTSLAQRPLAPVPEPSTYAMLAVGLLVSGAVVRRTRGVRSCQ